MRRTRRWVELGKDVLIAALALSAIALFTMTPLVQDSGLLSTTPLPVQAGRGDSVTLTAAAYPSRMALTSDAGRYGVQYDQSAVDQLFSQTGALLGEALTSAGQAEALDEERWRALLQGENLYFDFSGQIPLAALGSWLDPQGQQCALEGSARRILLAAGEEDTVLLCWQGEEDAFFSCQTGLSRSLHLSPAVTGTEENGALFAFENQSLSPLLDPYTLFTESVSQTVYAASTPVSSGSDLSWLLDALSFNGQNHTSITGGEAYLEGDDRLEVRSGGTVLFRAGQPGRYPVARTGAQPTLAEMVEAARELAEATIGANCGQARLHLISARETQEGWLIQFGYQLDGSSVWLYEDGWAAQFLVRDGFVTQFTLQFRTYTDTGEQAVLLPADRAAAILPTLTRQPRELVLQYRDQGESLVEPIWVAQ